MLLLIGGGLIEDFHDALMNCALMVLYWCCDGALMVLDGVLLTGCSDAALMVLLIG
jgi:hypothetical protein